MKIVNVSQATGKTHCLEINVDPQKVSDWADGKIRGNIQDIFPELSAAEREFLLTGITDEEWKEIFSGDEND